MRAGGLHSRHGDHPVGIDTALLDRLRVRHPGKDDREMIENIARIDLGFSLLRQAKSEPR